MSSNKDLGTLAKHGLTSIVSAITTTVILTTAWSRVSHDATDAKTIAVEARDKVTSLEKALVASNEAAQRSFSAIRLEMSAALGGLNVRLERIQTSLEHIQQMLKEQSARLSKVEAWRDGPQAAPPKDPK